MSKAAKERKVAAAAAAAEERVVRACIGRTHARAEGERTPSLYLASAVELSLSSVRPSVTSEGLARPLKALTPVRARSFSYYFCGDQIMLLSFQLS